MWDAADWAAAARQAAGALDPEPDVHATAAYRRSLAEALTRQALAEAAQAARAATDAPRRRPEVGRMTEQTVDVVLTVNGVPRTRDACRRGGCCRTACGTTCG